jgi:hypothetical protein
MHACVATVAQATLRDLKKIGVFVNDLAEVCGE